jgi:hypothetical protein
MVDRFEMGDLVVCIKKYETLKPKGYYSIKGCGDLTWNAATDKKGYGFCIEDSCFAYDKPNWWHLPHEEKVKWYYFTLEEMDDYFITQAEDYKSYVRDNKLKELGI